MNQQKIYQLFVKHLQTELSPEEKLELEEGLRAIDQQTFDFWVSSKVRIDENIQFQNRDVVFDRILENIDDFPPSTPAIKPWYKSIRYWAAAACVALPFSLFLYFENGLFPVNSGLTQNDMASKQLELLELPEENVLVTLADGTQMLFDGSNADTLVHKGIEITRSSDGVLVMRRSEDGANPFNANDRHKVSAPKGVALHLLLPDSSQVWLNSGSTISLLASYGKTDRRVELQGEGFFDVSHDEENPFTVSAKNSVVKVLGTQFNMSAYQDDADVKTTLIEGAVDISSSVDKLRLSPGQQAVVSSNAFILLNKSVNIKEIIDWKEGYFRFNDKPVGEILAELAKWYPIEEVQMQVSVSDTFTGSIKRSKKLGDILDAITSVSDLKFVVQGRRVVVMK